MCAFGGRKSQRNRETLKTRTDGIEKEQYPQGLMIQELGLRGLRLWTADKAVGPFPIRSSLTLI